MRGSTTSSKECSLEWRLSQSLLWQLVITTIVLYDADGRNIAGRLLDRLFADRSAGFTFALGSTIDWPPVVNLQQSICHRRAQAGHRAARERIVDAGRHDRLGLGRSGHERPFVPRRSPIPTTGYGPGPISLRASRFTFVSPYPNSI